MFFLVVIALVVAALAYTAYKIIKAKTFSFFTVVILIFALLGLGLIGYISYGLFYSFVYLPAQGKLINVLPDTKWVNDNLKIIFLQDRSLYLIDIRGTGRKKISDNVDEYRLSPDGEKVALWYRVKEGGSYEKTLMGITVLDLKNDVVEIVEKERNCGHPTWLADSSGVAYSFDDNYKICIFKINGGIKKIIEVPRMVRGLAVTKDGSRLAYSSLFDKKYYVYDFSSQSVNEISSGDSYAVNLDKDIDKSFWKGVRNVPLKSPDGGVELYNNKGSLWLKQHGTDELLVKYEGKHDDKLASGIQPVALSYDSQYIAFDFKGKIYICDTLSKKAGYLVEGYNAEFFGKELLSR